MAAPERRAQILAAARKCFCRSGFQAATTREIAAEAGISDALIYRHFPDKQALLTGLVDAAIDRFATLGPPPGVDTAIVPLDRLLTALGGSFLGAIEAESDILRLLLSGDHLADDHRFAAFVDTAATGLGRRLDAEGGDGRGYLMARGFMGALVAFVLLQRNLGLDAIRTVDASEFLRVQVDGVLAALGERSSAGR